MRELESYDKMTMMKINRQYYSVDLAITFVILDTLNIFLID